GVANLPAFLANHPRFAANAARDQAVTVSFRSNPDALAVWALVIPLFEELLAPIDLRTATGRPRPADRQRKDWDAVDATYAAVGIDGGEPLAVIRYGGGWSRMRIDDQTAAKHALYEQLTGQVGPDTARRWRAKVTLGLVDAYFRKAKKGPPLARSVLTRALHPALAGIFGSDWLGLLEYLGEKPNDAEQVVTSLPEARLYVGTSERKAEVAAEHGLAIDEVERILGAIFGDSSGISSIEQRTSAIRRWWAEFDQLHTARRAGMTPLRGLVDEGFSLIASDNDRDPNPALYRQMLPADLVAEIDRLWDGVTLPRWPDRIVSEFHPHRLMAETFGPAVDVWHGVALTCWYICEGPYSRTDLAGMARYYNRDLHALEQAGFPVDRSLFKDLTNAESRLGPPQAIESSREISTTTTGVRLTITTSMGQRRDGFEILRDIVTGHRRAWAAQHLDGYLRMRWDSELREVAREFNRRSAARAKAPTFKQFAGFATETANHWFGGDLAAVYVALGEPATGQTARHDLLVGDTYDFARAVWAELGGRDLPPTGDGAIHPDENRQRDLRYQIPRMALRFLQQYEALGRPPTLEEFGPERIRWEHLGGPETGWSRFTAAIEKHRRSPPAAGHGATQVSRPSPLPTGTPPPPPPLRTPPPPPLQPAGLPQVGKRRGFLNRLRGPRS
ncbi:MAG: TerD family protein, partial [Ilumatobacteraceae bacterium]